MDLPTSKIDVVYKLILYFMKTFLSALVISSISSFLLFFAISPREPYLSHILESIGIGIGVGLGLYYTTKKKTGKVV